jgi:hypothetical protein
MGQRMLLVEGRDDLFVMTSLFEARSVPEVFAVKEAGGIDKLIESLPVRLKGSNLERLAVVVDADDRIDATWDRIRAAVNKARMGDLPAQPVATGTTVELSSGIRFGAWVMPDNRIQGMLETFLAYLIPATDVLLPVVDTFLDRIPASQRLFSDAHHPKARMHTWLAVQKEPGLPFGTAITATFLDPHSTAVGPFLSWIGSALVT